MFFSVKIDFLSSKRLVNICISFSTHVFSHPFCFPGRPCVMTRSALGNLQRKAFRANQAAGMVSPRWGGGATNTKTHPHTNMELQRPPQTPTHAHLQWLVDGWLAMASNTHLFLYG